MKVYVPAGLNQSKLPNDGNLQAFITIDGRNRTEMEIIGNQARTTLQDISIGDHNFEIEFIFNSNAFGNGIVLSRATQNARVGNSSAGVSFNPQDYDSTYDDDSDGRTNLEELTADTPLHPRIPHIPMGESVMVTSQIPSEILPSNIPSGGTLRATLSVNGGEEQAMALSGNSVSLSLQDLTLEQHSFKIRFYVDSVSLGNNIPVAEIDQSANISASSDTPDFENATPNTAIDSDNDGQPNIVEVVAGTPPLPTPAPATPVPTVDPTPSPTVETTPTPTVEPTPITTIEPTPTPTVEPTPAPTVETTPTPTVEPTPTTTVEPTPTPTVMPAPQMSVTIVENFGDTLLVSEVLSVNVEFNPTINNEGTHSYQWLQNGEEIDGATNSTYAVRTDDLGAQLSVEVSPMNTNGDPITETAESNSVTVNDIPKATVTIIDANGGTPEIDDWLVGSYQYRDDDGDIEQGSTYRWLREISTDNYEPIGEPNEDRYQITSDDNGRRIRFEVTPRANTGMQEGTATLSSPLTVTNNAAPTAANVRITDDAENTISTNFVSNTIYGAFEYSDTEGDAFDADNTQYRWLRGDDIILDENGEPFQENNYTPTQQDSGQTLYFQITPYSESGNTIGETYRSMEGVLIENSAPSIRENSIEITDLDGGSLLVGNTVSVAYEFFDLDGDDEGATTFQWLRNGDDIPNDPENNIITNQSSYTLIAADADQAISVRITPIAVEGVLEGEPSTSSGVTVGNLAPEITSASINPASVNNVYVVGEELTISYEFNDTDNDLEGNSLFTWYSDNDIVLQGNGSNFRSYQTVSSDSGASIFVRITPIAQSGTQQGASVDTAAIVINALPQISNAGIAGATGGTAVIGTTLTAAYSLSDAEEPSQTSATFEWWRIIGLDDRLTINNETPETDDVLLSTQSNYTMEMENKGYEIELRITPLAATGSSPGATITTNRIAYENSLPEIENLSIGGYSGAIVIHQTTLEPSYSFNDDDGDLEETTAAGTQYRWYRVNGETRTLRGSDRNYSVQEADSGVTIELQVTPVSEDGAAGEMRSATVVVPVNTAPTVAAESIEILDNNNGQIIHGTTLTARYVFTDSEIDNEGTSTYRWYLGGDEILGATSRTLPVQTSYVGFPITFSVTPIASTGIQNGERVVSLPYYWLQYSANTGGTISGNSTQLVRQGSSGSTVTAQPDSGNGYMFANWGSAGDSASRTDTATGQGQLYQANFELDSYSLSLGFDGSLGNVTTTSSSPVEHGSTVIINIVLNNGTVIDSISGCTNGSLNTTTNVYTISSFVEPCNFMANFGLDEYTVTLNYTGAHGTVELQTPNAGGTVTHGTNAVFTITPLAGEYSIQSGDISTNASCSGSFSGSTYTIENLTNNNCELTVNFVELHSIDSTVTAGEGSVTINNPRLRHNEETTTVNVTPAAGYSIASVAGCGISGTTGQIVTTTYTTGTITNNCTISVSFELDADQLTPVLSLSYETVKTFIFRWSDVAGETEYRLFEMENLDDSYSQIATISRDSAEYELEVPLSYRVDASYYLQACVGSECFDSNEVFVDSDINNAIGYLKPFNTREGFRFGYKLEVSGDGTTLAVVAPEENSTSSTDQTISDATGGVYVYRKDGNTWTHQTLIKPPSEVSAGEEFGYDISISDDGNVLAVSAYLEDSTLDGSGNLINGQVVGSGTVFLYRRNNGNWTLEENIKASNVGNAGSDLYDQFGYSLALSGDGTKLAVGGYDSSCVRNDPNNNGCTRAGAVFYFAESNNSWNEEIYIKPAIINASDTFGASVALSYDGSTLIAGAPKEDSNSTGIDGNESNNTEEDNGAAYIYNINFIERSYSQTYIKHSTLINPAPFGGLQFGQSVAISDDGQRALVGSRRNEVHIFERNAGSWIETHILSESNGGAYGNAFSISADGNTILTSDSYNNSPDVGLSGSNSGTSAPLSGAVFLYKLVNNNWESQAFLKPLASDVANYFGTAVSISNDGLDIFVGHQSEQGNGTDTDGDPEDNSLNNAGAVYIY